jgi:hypothetical protein
MMSAYRFQNTWKIPDRVVCGNLRVTSALTSGIILAPGKYGESLRTTRFKSSDIPYEPAFARTLPNYYNLYYGASISALRSLAKRKGYTFVGSNSAGNNAFFICNDYASRFDRAVVTHAVASPSQVRESRDASGNLTFAEGIARQTLISSLPVINIEIGERITIGSLGNLCSDDWL